MYDAQSGRVVVELPYQIQNVYEAEFQTRRLSTPVEYPHPLNEQILQNQAIDQLLADIQSVKITSSWLYYTKGNGLVERTAAYMKRGDYQLAVRFMTENARQLDGLKKQDRAVYNFATALYLAGKKQEALIKAGEGLDKYGASSFRTLIHKNTKSINI
ncbi:MAG: hypothetical protein R2795_20730 [Saprospiraceae bacterium]